MSDSFNNPYRVIRVLTRMRFAIILRVHSIVTVKKVIRNSAPRIIAVLFSRFRNLISNKSFANVTLAMYFMEIVLDFLKKNYILTVENAS